MKISHQPALVVQENHYYPFGLNITSLEKQGVPQHRWQFMGVEKEESFGINWQETKFRGYDPQLGRFHQIDMLTHLLPTINPYQYAFNSPVIINDPTGLMGEEPEYLASTFVDPSGKVIEHRDDGDPLVYFVPDPLKWDGSKDGLSVLGFEKPGQRYKKGDKYEQYTPVS